MYSHQTPLERFEHSCKVVFDRYINKKYGALHLEARCAIYDRFEDLMLGFEAEEKKIADYFGLVEGGDNSNRCTETIMRELFEQWEAQAMKDD